MITDWGFYAVAVPAVLLLGISKSGFGAGFGSLAVPLMALSVSVPQAAAILMPVLLVMDLLGIAAFRKDFDRRLLRFLLPWGLVGTGGSFALCGLLAGLPGLSFAVGIYLPMASLSPIYLGGCVRRFVDARRGESTGESEPGVLAASGMTVEVLEG